ncbi:MAG: NAD(P)H:quinone oxidoreductase [Gammaproteobacteria bacterium]
MDNYILILFYSLTGSVKFLAHAIADGVEDEGMEVRIRTVPRISSNHEASEKVIPAEGEMYCTLDDLAACSGLALGSPTRFGSIAAPLKYFLDSTGELWSKNILENKPGLAFTSTGSMHGGQEITLFGLITFMLHHGMTILGSPYSIPELQSTSSGGTPYGPSHVNSKKNTELTDEEYIIAFQSGRRLAKLATLLS